VLLDLNEFKLINDNHGHAVGDEVLREIGVRLVDAVAQSGTAARLGGDEFMVVSAALDESSREDLIRRITLMFDSPIEVGRQRFIVSASIGVVTGHHPDSGEQLLADADAAMYQAKEGSAREVATVVLDAAGRLESSRQLRIREAIARPDVNHFAVMYQPVIDLTTGHIVGVEALLRWRHPDLGPVSPEVFIALAERAGSIDVLGDFVLRQATRDLADLHLRHPERDLTVGINVSPRQLGDASFADRALGIIEAAGLQPRHVTIEITEQAFEADLAPVRAGVDQLVAAGADVAVDDFGTGYSSLRYLQRLRLTVMKIDRDFVADIGHEPAATRLVASLTAMAAMLDLSVVAEGIESREQLGVLRGLNCRYGQGYLFSPPVPIEQIDELLAANHTYPLELGERRLPNQRDIRAVAPVDVIHSSVSGSSNDLEVVNR
jgi:diguanylate cyclase (GGDEF)-like protein